MPDDGDERPLAWTTRLLQPDDRAPAGFRSLVPAVHRGSTTLFPDVASVRDTWDQRQAPYTYGQYGTPTTLELATRIAELEHGTWTFLTPGGQAALSLVDLAFLSAGDHVLLPESVYGPSRELADGLLTRLGIEVSAYPPLAGAAIRDHLRPTTKLVWTESPGSNTMEIQDVPAIAEAAHEHGAVVALDNTWSAGVLFDAFGHGVDVSVQALTKYVGGHSDVLLGAVTVREETAYQRVGQTLYELGSVVSPDDCSLALRGLQTLPLRLAAIGRSALDIARWLGDRPEIELVLHPALPSCPGHDIWRRDFTGSSGTFSIVFAPRFDRAAVHRFVDALRLFRIGYSWGGVTSLVVPRGGDERYGDRLVRLSIGLEDPGDLIADLEHGLASLRRDP